MPAKSEDVDLEVVDELDEVAEDADLDADDVKDSGTEEPDEDGKYAAGDIQTANSTRRVSISTKLAFPSY
ncbi:MAG: hypothetical protein H6962_11070 [Chromatiaceae bacterium]|nr:hypothetical protein [Chromatiaceae bacterium]